MVDFPVLAAVNYADVRGTAALMQTLVSPWMQQATIAVLDPEQRVIDTDYDTGITTVTWNPIYACRARVQPIKDVLTIKATVNDSTSRTVQFWPDYLPDFGAPDWRPGLEICVVDGYNDPDLENYQYVVSGAMNSSMGWQRTVQCHVNLEGRPNYPVGDWDLSPWLDYDGDAPFGLHEDPDNPGYYIP